MTRTLRALTLHQPSASLVVTPLPLAPSDPRRHRIRRTIKPIETRSWRTSHRGPFAIHAAGTAASRADAPWAWRFYDAGRRAGRLPAEPPRGVIIGSADLVDCVPIFEEGHFTDRRAPAVWVQVRADGRVWLRRRHPESGVIGITQIDEQRRLGDYTPGRWAWLLDDIKPTTERCPACWPCDLCGAVSFTPWREDPAHRMCTACGHVCAHPPCRICAGAGCCDPIPAIGRQGLWSWEPDPAAEQPVAADGSSV
jgi:hypothetical protein